METITENLNWTECRDQWIMGIPAPRDVSPSQLLLYSSGTILETKAEGLQEAEYHVSVVKLHCSLTDCTIATLCPDEVSCDGSHVL